MSRVQGIMNRGQDMATYKYKHAQWRAAGEDGEPPALPERLQAFRGEAMGKLDNSYAVDAARKSGVYKHIPNEERGFFRKDPKKFVDALRKKFSSGEEKVFQRFNPRIQAKVMKDPLFFYVLKTKHRQNEEKKAAEESSWFSW